MEAQLKHAQGRTQQAADQVIALVELTEHKGDSLLQVTFLLFLARIHHEADDAVRSLLRVTRQHCLIVLSRSLSIL